MGQRVIEMRAPRILILALAIGIAFAEAPVVDVYRDFGWSVDSRYFLYLKSAGGYPAFTLHCFDAVRKTDRIVAESVHNAVWAPNQLQAAYAVLDSPSHFRLFVYEPASGTSQLVFRGMVDPASLEWSLDGNQLLFVSAAGLTETSFDDRQYEYRLHKYDTHGGSEIVDKFPFPTSITPLAAAQPSVFHLPFEGSAYLVQGGASFTNGICDGRRCLVMGHNRGLGLALDWQQTPEDGQGNQHILAVADGTVVATANNVTCNSVNKSCRVGQDGYRNPCASNDGAGNYVLLAHADGSYSLYAHLKSGSVKVARNQKVMQGTYLGDQGHSGSANSPTKFRTCGDHLHFQRQRSPAVFSPSIATDFGEVPCTTSCLTAYISSNIDNRPSTTDLLDLSLAPATVVGSLVTVGNKVILRAAAPAGGAVVKLASSDPGRASVPAAVTVKGGQKWAPFLVTVNGNVSVPMPVVISAMRGSSTATAQLTVAPPSIAQLTLAAATIIGGKSLAANEIALNGVAAYDVPVTLTSSKPSVVPVPATWTIGHGQTFALFNLSTKRVSTPTVVTIKASLRDITKAVTLTVKPSQQ